MEIHKKLVLIRNAEQKTVDMTPYMKQLNTILLVALEVCIIRVARKKKHPESESLYPRNTQLINFWF